MNFGTKNKLNHFDSKNQPDKNFNQIFKLLCATISDKQMNSDHHEAQNINDETIEILDAVMDLVRERDENIKIEDEAFRSAMNHINTTLEAQIASVL